MKAVVLAAGKGTRLSPLTHYKAKPMVPVANRPVMEHIIENLHKNGIRNIFSNLYYRPADIMGYFGDGSRWDVSIHWIVEEQLTGPAGGVATFANFLEDEEMIIVLSGDALHNIDLQALADFHKNHNALLSVVMKKVVNPGRYGVGSVDQDNRIVRFVEKPAVDPASQGLVSCGIYCLSKDLVKRIPQGVVYDFGADLIPALAAANEAVFCFETSSYWKDIGTFAELRQANLDVVAEKTGVSVPGNENRQGVFIEAGAVIDADVEIVPPVLIGKGSRIGKNVYLIGPLVLEASVIVEEGAYISNSVVLEGTHLLPGTMVIDGIMGTFLSL